jgi:glycosyltransferase involved in cell wall biosynthesis
MKIGLIIYGNINIQTGGFFYDRQLKEFLETQGAEVHIITLPWRQYPQHLTDNFSFNLFKRIKEKKLDILLQDELNHPSLFLFNYFTKRNISCPKVSIVHHLRTSEKEKRYFNYFQRLFERLYLQSVNAYIFNSETTKKSVFELFQSSYPYIVAYPGGNHRNSEISYKKILNRSTEKQFKILFVGNLIPRKGLHKLLEALAGINHFDFTLNIVGSKHFNPKYSLYIEEQIKKYNLSEKVHILESLTDEQLESEFSKSHILVVPSSYEGFGIVYIEGMAFGLPIIGGNNGAMSEIVSHGKNGFLVPYDNSALLKSHIMNLANNRSLLNNMSNNSLDKFLSHPTWNESMKKIWDFLQYITSTKTNN